MRLLLYITLAALLGTCSSQPAILDQILEVGELRVVTRDSPTAFVEGPDGPSGPEFDLAQAFEIVPHYILMGIAKAKRYPLISLRLSLEAYWLRRTVGIDSVYSRTIVVRMSFCTPNPKIQFFVCPRRPRNLQHSN